MKDAVYRVETTRLVLRCWSPEDASAVKEAEDESRQHLSTFMIWAAKGPQTLEDVVAKLRVFRSWFDTNEDYMYGAFDRDSGRIVGGCGLHARARSRIPPSRPPLRQPSEAVGIGRGRGRASPTQRTPPDRAPRSRPSRASPSLPPPPPSAPQNGAAGIAAGGSVRARS